MRWWESFIIALFLVVFMGSYSLAVNPPKEEHHSGHHHERVEDESLELSGRVENGIRVIEVKASRYKFEPDPMVVKLGEKVRLVTTSADVTHGLFIPEFNVNIVIPVDKTESIEFIADKEGTFVTYCSVYCGPKHAHMHGTLIVVKE